jgi:hypothetical protein
MPSWHDRFVTKARTDSVLRRKLQELARLDALAMSTAGQALSASWTQNAAKVERLCDEVSERVVESGEDVGEVAQWISYHCQEVARSLPATTASIGSLIPIVLAIIVGVLVYRWSHSWLGTILGILATVSVGSWVRSRS